jgi:putative tricarboxylic transport membrane protein
VTDTLTSLADGLRAAATPAHLLWSIAGAALGTFVGVLPGIGPALTVSLLLPLTLALEPASAFIMFGGIYYGAMYGGSTTTILLNTPGESASMMTALDGHEMARQGRAAAALATAAIGSFVAGTIATLGLTFLAPALAASALLFGPAEYFGLAMVAFAAITTLVGPSLVRGLASLFFGLALGLIGIDPLTGAARLSLGIPQLLDGIDVVLLVIGLFAVGETFYLAWTQGRVPETVASIAGSRWMTREDWSRSWRPWLRGTAIGFPLGALPCGGAEIPTLLSYSLERRLAPEPRRFGAGAIEGVAGPEAANNAAAAGVLAPLLALGLPTSATAAVLLAAFQQYGLQPGPLLFQTQPELLWTMIASLYIGNVMLLALNLPLVGLWARVLLLPKPFLFGGVIVLATVGAFSLSGSILDVAVVYIVGAAGCWMRLHRFPMAPAVLGLILGPLAEQQFRRALAIGEGSLFVFLDRPLSAILLAAAGAIVLVPFFRRTSETRELRPD